MPAAGDEALEHCLASNRRIQVKGLWIELARERNYLFLGDLVGTRLESVASFEIFEVTLAHRELFFCRIAPVSAMCKVRRNFRRRAVSSVVEHLVYTERVGGSKPSPPSSESGVRHGESAHWRIRGRTSRPCQQLHRSRKNNLLPLGVFFGRRMQTIFCYE